MKTRKILGLDIGGVLACREHVKDGGHQSLFNPDDSYLTIQPISGSLEAVLQLGKLFEEVHLVSKIDMGQPIRQEARSLRWLRLWGFLDMIPEQNVHFCPTHQSKAPICRNLGVNYFVDDRLAVLQHLFAVSNLLWFRSNLGSDLDLVRFVRERHIRVASSWRRACEELKVMAR